MNKKILQIAIPSIVSNITVPLLGLVDVAIVGHLGATSYMGAIAVGGMLFNMIYWLFAFLRMGTSGMTSQAYGRRDLQAVLLVWERALLIGVGIALLMIASQELILQGAFYWIETTDEIKPTQAAISTSACGAHPPSWGCMPCRAGLSACKTPASPCSSQSYRTSSTSPAACAS